MIVMNAKGEIFGKKSFQSHQNKYSLQEWKDCFSTHFQRFFTHLLFLKDCNLMQGHVPWMPIFLQYALTVRLFPMGLQDISCITNRIQTD